MDRTSALVRLSLDRSLTRRRVLLMLASLGEAYVGQLAKLTRVDRSRVLAVLHGRVPAFAPQRSLVGLGLARVVHRDGGRVIEITPRGLRQARRLTARYRSASAKRAVLDGA